MSISPYSQYVREFVRQANRIFVDLLDLQIDFAQNGIPGDRFGVIHVSNLQKKRIAKVRTGYEFRQINLDFLINLITATRLEAEEEAASLMIDLDAAFPLMTERIETKFLHDFQLESDPSVIVRPNTIAKPHNWLARVVATASVGIIFYKDAKGNHVLADDIKPKPAKSAPGFDTETTV